MKLLFKKQSFEESIDKILKLKRQHAYTRIGIRGTCVLALVSLALATVLMPSFTLPRRTYVEGESAGSTIRANRGFEIIDIQATQKLKEIVESGVKPVYDYDVHLISRTIKKLFTAFERMRKDSALHTRQEAKKGFEAALGGILIEEGLCSFLEEEKFDWRISWGINRLLQLIKNDFIAADKGSLIAEISKGISIKNIDEDKELIFDDFDKLLDISEARKRIENMIPKYFRAYSFRQQKYVKDLVFVLLSPNFSFNSAETSRRKSLAVNEAKPILIKVEKGETILRKGDPVQKRHLVILEGIRSQFTEQRPLLFIFYTALFFFFFLQILSYFALTHFSHFKPSKKDVLVLSSLAIFFLLGIKTYLFISGALSDRLTWLTFSTLVYFIPFSACAMMVRFLIGVEGAFTFSLLISMASGLLLEKNFLYVAYILSTSFVGIQSIAFCRNYTDIYRAGLRVALANVAIVFSIIILSTLGRSASYEEVIVELSSGLVSAFLSGILASIVVVTVTPLFEYLFGYTTDIKLIELSNLNNPVLRDLMIRAPGSYHHCIMVGTLAENAAEALGVDALLARVGGYYHDIGKMKNPHYYIENQFGGFNIHDKQLPHLSRIMIISHVKEGVKLGIDKNLGQKIIDIIAQHHGTTLMMYFYQKAKQLLKEEKIEEEGSSQIHEVDVDENEYRYEGPRPQTVEAAIVMLADSVEAAARALNTAHLPRLKVVCERIINRLFADEQLNECDLTLRDLNIISSSFYHVLVGVYHRRISYPGGIRAEQPYDANYYPKSAKEDENSNPENSSLAEDDIFKKMGN